MYLVIPVNVVCTTVQKHITNKGRAYTEGIWLRIFGPKRDEVTGEWRKLHNEELHILYSAPDIIRQVKSRRMRWAGHVARMGEERKLYRVSVGSLKGKRPHGRPRHRLEDGIRVDLREISWGRDVDWIPLAQGFGGKSQRKETTRKTKA
jgi:hypothetical protein